jgi:hypothetical protein
VQLTQLLRRSLLATFLEVFETTFYRALGRDTVRHKDAILIFVFFRVNGKMDVDGSRGSFMRLGAAERWNESLRFSTSAL